MTRDAEEAARAYLALLDAPWHSVPDMERARYEATQALRIALDRSTGGGGETVAWAIKGCDGQIDTLRFHPKCLADEECARRNSDEYSNDAQKIVARRPFVVVPLYAAPTGATGGEYERGVEDAAKCCDERAERLDVHATNLGVMGDSVHEVYYHDAATESRECAAAIRSLARNEGDHGHDTGRGV